MEFGLIALFLAVGYVIHRIFHPVRPALEVALEHLQNDNPVRAECVAEQAYRAARRRPTSLAAGKAGVDLAHILLRVGDRRRAGKVLAEATVVLGENGADLSRAQGVQAQLSTTSVDTASEDDEWQDEGGWQTVSGPAPQMAAADGPAIPKIADRCATGGCGCGPAGVVEPEASRAFATLLAGGRAAGLIGAAEIRREGERLTPRITVNGDLTDEQEKVVERAVRGAMGVLFGT